MDLSIGKLFGYQPVQPVEAAGVSAARKAEHKPFLAAPRTDAYAEHDRALEQGHNGSNQYVNKRVGYCNTLGIG